MGRTRESWRLFEDWLYWLAAWLKKNISRMETGDWMAELIIFILILSSYIEDIFTHIGADSQDLFRHSRDDSGDQLAKGGHGLWRRSAWGLLGVFGRILGCSQLDHWGFWRKLTVEDSRPLHELFVKPSDWKTHLVRGCRTQGSVEATILVSVKTVPAILGRNCLHRQKLRFEIVIC